MTISLTIQPFDHDIEAPFARLFTAEGFDRSPAYLRWAFDGFQGRGFVAVARDSEMQEMVVGVLGLLPSQLKVGESIVPGYAAIDLVVDQHYRGRGIFAGLGEIALAKATASGAQLVWGFPNQAAAHAWFGRFGWTNMGVVPLMVRPLRSRFVLKRFASVGVALDVRLIRPTSESSTGIREIKNFGQEADQLWAGFSQRTNCCTVREPEWLNWRLFQRPGKSYRTVASFDDRMNMRAFVSSSIEQKSGDSILYIMEAMSRNPHDDGSLGSLLRSELYRAASAGADAAFCWCTPNSPNYAAYRRAGFWRVPTRLRPTVSYFGVKTFADHPTLTDVHSWYVSFLDLDTV